MSSVRVLRRTAAALIAGVLAAVTLSVPPAGATGTTYVALGDSFSSGPLILPQTDPVTCLRSAINYPGLVAKQLKVGTFRDVTCSGATTQNFSGTQAGTIAGTAAPQYDALSRSTTLVTVGIGGNDIGLVGLAESCIAVAPGVGGGCKAKNTAGGVDVYARKIDAFASTYATVISRIRARAPYAKIVFVGYPTGIKPGGCYPYQPILAADADYLQGNIDRLNLRMKQQAAAHGVTYVDVRTPSVGHDACQLPGTRWIEGLLPAGANGFMPLHPNAYGMAADARAVLAALHA